MPFTPTAYAKDTEPIHPESLYPYQCFIRCSGVSKSKIREAMLQGIIIKTIDSGRRKYVRGVDGIAFINKLAEIDGGLIHQKPRFFTPTHTRSNRSAPLGACWQTGWGRRHFPGRFLSQE